MSKEQLTPLLHTAVLSDWVIVAIHGSQDYKLAATITDDRKFRFEDGTRIMTSRIDNALYDVKRLEAGDLVTTVNTTYTLGQPLTPLTEDATTDSVSKLNHEPFDTLEYYVDNILQWAEERNLIKGSTSKDQFCKLMQETGELSDNLCKQNSISDDIGDCMVVLTIIAAQQNLSIEECLDQAWNDIKDRKGTMVDGIFIKEIDHHPI